jgi:cyclohexadienyl dehydratase
MITRLFLLLTLSTTLAASEPATSSAVAEDQLYEVINQRLSLMKQVAAYKWINKLPIEAPAREKVVIKKASLSGLNHGVTVDSSERFFRSQIEAAKDIQRCWFDTWHLGEPPTSAEDLNATVRPKLIRLGDEITRELTASPNDISRYQQQVNEPCLSDTAKQKMFESLALIRTYPDHITQIKHSGLLRVGTTGDYAPFSHRQTSQKQSSDKHVSPKQPSPKQDELFEGIDIDLARDLAAALDLEVVLVRTSWPTLMEDLLEGKYDIAMSGVSRTASREKTASFSTPYHIGGKTPIALCTRKHEFDALQKIDQPEITLIVNPGGTNEKFIDARISNAKKKLHTDNRTIFRALIAGDADLMITDLIEVQLQSSINTSLCATMEGQTLTYQEKAYMMPKDSLLVPLVNQWMSSRVESGTIKRAFQHHLEPAD